MSTFTLGAGFESFQHIMDVEAEATVSVKSGSNDEAAETVEETPMETPETVEEVEDNNATEEKQDEELDQTEDELNQTMKAVDFMNSTANTIGGAIAVMKKYGSSAGLLEYMNLTINFESRIKKFVGKKIISVEKYIGNDIQTKALITASESTLRDINNKLDLSNKRIKIGLETFMEKLKVGIANLFRSWDGIIAKLLKYDYNKLSKVNLKDIDDKGELKGYDKKGFMAALKLADTALANGGQLFKEVEGLVKDPSMEHLKQVRQKYFDLANKFGSEFGVHGKIFTGRGGYLGEFEDNALKETVPSELGFTANDIKSTLMPIKSLIKKLSNIDAGPKDSNYDLSDAASGESQAPMSTILASIAIASIVHGIASQIPFVKFYADEIYKYIKQKALDRHFDITAEARELIRQIIEISCSIAAMALAVIKENVRTFEIILDRMVDAYKKTGDSY